MQSQATSVTAYLQEVPAERRAALKRLRTLCRATLKGFEESMQYGGPCYKRNGVVEVGFASQKNFIGLYILRTDVMNAYRHLLKGKGVSVGKGAIRYSQPEKIDFQVVESMLRATLESSGEVCGRGPRFSVMTHRNTNEQTRTQVEEIYRTESRRIFATLVRLLGDFDLAEDALHDAFREAMEKWPRDGVPASPRAWLVSTGRFKAIDTLRRRARFDASLADLAEQLDHEPEKANEGDNDDIQDDRLRLIFTCCHPALSPEARAALTLREVCGLTTEDIAHAFLTTPATLAQRIVRAKARIREARIPYEVPSREALPERLEAVLQVIYLVFNEGYFASSGSTLTRPDLSGEAIRLGRLLCELLPEPEAMGLLALMLLHEARRAARTSAEGDVILLEDQDRSSWNPDLIREGTALVERALSSDSVGAYALQAGIAAVYAAAPDFHATDWGQIIGLYDLLLQVTPSPVVEINRAAAVAMRDGPAAGLELIDAILESGELVNYALAHAARADLYRRLGRIAEARAAYQQALTFAQQEPQRRLLERRIAGLGTEF